MLRKSKFRCNNYFQNLIFRFLQNRSRVAVWIYQNTTLRIEGVIIGFDEYMNLVLDDADEVNTKTNARKSCGKC